MEKIPLHESRDLLESSSDMGYFTRPRMVESGSFTIALRCKRERLLEVRDIVTMGLHPCRRTLYTEKWEWSYIARVRTIEWVGISMFLYGVPTSRNSTQSCKESLSSTSEWESWVECDLRKLHSISWDDTKWCHEYIRTLKLRTSIPDVVEYLAWCTMTMYILKRSIGSLYEYTHIEKCWKREWWEDDERDEKWLLLPPYRSRYITSRTSHMKWPRKCSSIDVTIFFLSGDDRLSSYIESPIWERKWRWYIERSTPGFLIEKSFSDKIRVKKISSREIQSRKRTESVERESPRKWEVSGISSSWKYRIHDRLRRADSMEIWHRERSSDIEWRRISRK